MIFRAFRGLEEGGGSVGGIKPLISRKTVGRWKIKSDALEREGVPWKPSGDLLLPRPIICCLSGRRTIELARIRSKETLSADESFPVQRFVSDAN